MMGALVNLNRGDEPMTRVSEAELLRLIAERADHDIEGSGWGDFSHGQLASQPLQPAEAATELGADSPNPAAAEAWLLARWFARWPRLAPWVVSVGIVLLMGLAGSGDDQIEQLSAERAEELASAQELQP